MAKVDPSTELGASSLEARERERDSEKPLHARHLEALMAVASILVEPGTNERKTIRVLEAITTVAEVEWTTLWLFDEQEQDLRLVASVGAGLEEYPPLPNLEGAELISGVAFEGGESVVVNDYPSYPRALPDLVADGVMSVASLVLKTGGRVVGTLSVDSRESGHFTPERVRFLSAIADGMAALVDNSLLLEDLQEGEERYYTLFEQSRDAIFISRRGRVVDCNQACLDLFGYRRDQVPELVDADLYADSDEHVKLNETIHRQGSVQDFEVRFKKRDGTEMDCLLTAALLRDENGDEVGVHGIVRDITERIRAEQALRDSEAEARRRAEQMRAINDFAVTVSSILSLEELLPYVVTLLRDTFGYYSVNIGLIDTDSGYLVVRAGTPVAEGSPPFGTAAFRLGDEGICAWVARTGETLVVNDVSKDPRYVLVEDLKDTRAELTVPITIGDDLVGVLDVQSSEVDAFDEMDLVTAQTLANQLAVAIENARLFGESRELAVLEERNRIAREIHDTLAQGLTGIVLQLEAGEQALGQDSDEVQGHLTRARDLARQCLQEARRSVWDLLPQALEESPIHEALQEEVERFSGSGHGRATFEISGEGRQLSAGVQTALLRICQEALNNVRKHAHASEAAVRLSFQPDTVSLEVSDDGRGFDPLAGGVETEGGGFGMIGMRQRASLLRGELAVTSKPDSGTRVQVTIPAP